MSTCTQIPHTRAKGFHAHAPASVWLLHLPLRSAGRYAGHTSGPRLPHPSATPLHLSTLAAGSAAHASVAWLSVNPATSRTPVALWGELGKGGCHATRGRHVAHLTLREPRLGRPLNFLASQAAGEEPSTCAVGSRGIAHTDPRHSQHPTLAGCRAHCISGQPMGWAGHASGPPLGPKPAQQPHLRPLPASHPGSPVTPFAAHLRLPPISGPCVPARAQPPPPVRSTLSR